MVKEAFAKPIRPRPLVACTTRLSGQQPPRIWTPEEALEAREFQEYMAMKRDRYRRARSDETQDEHPTRKPYTRHLLKSNI